MSGVIISHNRLAVVLPWILVVRFHVLLLAYVILVQALIVFPKFTVLQLVLAETAIPIHDILIIIHRLIRNFFMACG